MKTLLLVEDNEDNRDMLARRLRRKGYRVETAVNGKEALDMLQDIRPDLVLMDLSMPVMDGWEATRRIKQDPGLRDIPVVVLTGHAMKEDREKALSVGADGYIPKPIDMQALLTCLNDLLENAP
ncbi:MAG: response regulator [Gammaproteobacteria bacterium]|nr:MAG: response regulator [Gammaproteobacteria bacterium]